MPGMRYIKAILDQWPHFIHANLWFRKKDFGPKIFCIGYNKTGTTSLGQALRMLGYRHASFNKRVWRDYYRNGKIDKILSYTAKFESFDDLPWLMPDMIPVLDEKFPGSKFIYLHREEEAWKRSYDQWRQKLFGEIPDLDVEVAKYREHHEFVSGYFEGRSANEFIQLDIKDPQGFAKLSDFLGKEHIQADFPHQNSTSNLRGRLRKRKLEKEIARRSK